MKCDYKDSLQTCRGDAIATYHITVFYKDGTREDLNLCIGCIFWIKEDARKCGFEWELTQLQ